MTNASTAASAGSFTAAALQMVSTPDPVQNREVAQRLVREAAVSGAQLVVLPEYWAILGRHEQDKLAHAERPGDGPLQQFMAALARDTGIWLLGGTIPLVSDQPGKVLNSLLAYGPDGALAARYDKIHLFGFSRGDESFDEARTIAPGDAVGVLETPFARVGLSICYDLRFPELYRAMGHCDLVVVPSAFTYTTGSAHWEVLLRARAIENQCYVLAAAQGGRHPNGRRTWGHSMLVDPWGEVDAVLVEGEGVVAGAIERARIDDVRSSLPALGHRKL
ncbi:MAG: carbon-nitrogen hydrolase family protein [Burkholderiaceae bacterium]|nr:carbon-nitrogen hydrolase family protein [Burkholderiaceae bacterium]